MVGQITLVKKGKERGSTLWCDESCMQNALALILGVSSYKRALGTCTGNDEEPLPSELGGLHLSTLETNLKSE